MNSHISILLRNNLSCNWIYLSCCQVYSYSLNLSHFNRNRRDFFTLLYTEFFLSKSKSFYNKKAYSESHLLIKRHKLVKGIMKIEKFKFESRKIILVNIFFSLKSVKELKKVFLKNVMRATFIQIPIKALKQN